MFVMRAACLLVLAACVREEPAPRPPPPPPPCYPDGVFQASGQRTYSSGSVCNLNDVAQLQGEVTIRRTGFDTVEVTQRGKYAHSASLDPYACVVWTARSPTYGANLVLGAKVNGSAAYRVAIRPDGSLAGTAQLDVQSNSFLVPPCQAAFNVWGQRLR